MRILAAFLVFLALPVNGEIFADMLIRHRPTSATEDQLTTVRIRLEHEKVPRIVAHFIGLATGERAWIDPTTGVIQEGVNYYDGLIFHRLIHNFVLQGGDPKGTGTSGPGFVVQDQFDQSLRHSGRYFLSCAKTSNPNTFGSQFFITLEAAPHLDDKHPVFGEVVNVSAEDTSSRDFIDALTSVTEYPTGASNKPVTPISIVSISFSGADYEGFSLDDPSYRLPYVVGTETRITHSYDALGAHEMTAHIDRKASFNYHNYYSTNLKNWTYFRSLLSIDEEENYEFLVTGVPGKFFYREVAIDYTQIYNPDPGIFTNGSTLRFQSANGDFITLTSDGNGAGTWVDGDGASGILSRFEIFDTAPDTGIFIRDADQAEYLPLMNLEVDFAVPAGIPAYTAIDGILSFHSETVGGFEGTVLKPNSTSFNRPFVFTPAAP